MMGYTRTFKCRLSEEDYQWIRDKAYKKSTNKKKVSLSEIVRTTIKNARLADDIKNSLKGKVPIINLKEINTEDLEKIINKKAPKDGY